MAEFTYFKVKKNTVLSRLVDSFAQRITDNRIARLDYAAAQGAVNFYGRGAYVEGLIFKDKPTQPGWRKDLKNRLLGADQGIAYCPDKKNKNKDGFKREIDLQGLQSPSAIHFDSDLREKIFGVDPKEGRSMSGGVQTGPMVGGTGMPVGWSSFAIYGKTAIVKVPIAWGKQEASIPTSKVEAIGGKEIRMSEFLEIQAAFRKEQEKEKEADATKEKQ